MMMMINDFDKPLSKNFVKKNLFRKYFFMDIELFKNYITSYS